MMIGYTGEQWRQGEIGVNDHLDFQYSTDGSTWFDVNDLDFSTVVPSPVGASNGNTARNRRPRNARIDIAVPAGGSFWIRWTDRDITGVDDGLAVENFVLVPGGPLPVTRLGPQTTQTFDSLSATANSAVAPPGWAFLDTGSNAVADYLASDGSDGIGGTHSYGLSPADDRAFGSRRTDLESGTVGVALRNDTGAAITALDLLYRAEQWSSGGSGNIDKVEGAYSLNATRLDNGTWTALPALDFSTPNPGAPGGG